MQGLYANPGGGLRPVHPPGSAGRTLLSDRSVELWRDPVRFVSAGVEQHGARAFLTRLLLRPTVVLADNRAVRHLLRDRETFQCGLRDMFMPLLGENLVFMEGGRADSIRASLHSLFSSETATNYQAITERVTRHWLEQLDSDRPVDLYAAFKQLSMELNLAVFLGLERRERGADVAAVTDIATTHWHGLYALPVSVSVPFTTSSSYKQAMDAKEQLLTLADQMLRDDAQSAFIESLKLAVEDPETRRNHLLLCASAMVPKALASLLTSAIVASPQWKERYVSDDGDISDDDLTCVLLEVQRLYPPFFGGRRLVTRDAQVGEYLVSRGQAVVYGTAAAHRDPAVFPNADTFDPERWRTSNKNDQDKLFCFGGGPRACIGQKMYQHILKVACRMFISEFDWHLPATWRPTWKHLPVSRPTNLPSLVLSRRSEAEQWQDATS
ncbi:putative cytochrome P450 120 [Amphibalanus amphitrite]|uniref:Putative cytochrome P450 120 n=1 Tax=Amphibalanus amphitrite TaxID=1232801 RepID=A0A6A4VD04_AMPAM|nr:putative cytochrome P450 120 [Amphibalanus amphitrite]